MAKKQLATLPLETLNEALQFIASQPYAQVADLISKLQQETQVSESDEEAESEDGASEEWSNRVHDKNKVR